MRTFATLALIFGLGLALPSAASAQGAVSSHRFGMDFGDSSLQKQGVDLPLKIQEGKTYHFTLEMKPYRESSFSSPEPEGGGATGGSEGSAQGGREKATGCNHEAWMKATNVSGDETTVNFTFDASKCEKCREKAKETGSPMPGKIEYTAKVTKDGDITSFQRQDRGQGQDASSGGSTGKESGFDDMLKTHAEQLLGYGLHGKKLEPDRMYDVAWMHPENWETKSHHDGAHEPSTGAGASSTGGSSSSGGSSQERSGEASWGAGKSFALRYDGKAKTEASEAAHFRIVPAAGSFSSPESGSSAGGSSGEGQEIGKVNFRLEDGLLDRFAMVMDPSFMKEGEHGSKAGEPGTREMKKFVITIRRAD